VSGGDLSVNHGVDDISGSEVLYFWFLPALRSISYILSCPVLSLWQSHGELTSVNEQGAVDVIKALNPISKH
jgi:hypothetical protein